LGTVAGQTVAVGSTIAPFAAANTSDGSPGPDYVSDTLTISLLGSDGNATDSDGTLSSGETTGNTTFSEISPGVYSLSVTNPAVDTVTNTDTLNAQLHNLIFTPSTPGTTTLSVHVTDKYVGEQSTDNTTTIIASGGTTPAAPAPTTPTPTTSDTTPATSTPLTPVTPQFVQSTATTNGSTATVLDASGGGSFLIGATPDGTIMIDGRDSTSTSWSAISVIQSGDTVTLVGVTKDDFSIGHASGQHAAGFKGATLDVSTSGNLNPSSASASGKVANLMNGDTARLFGGRLTASFGNESDGTPFMKLQA
jgi:hypothetical protein